MKKGICTIEGCGYTFTHKDQVVINRALGVHRRFKHGIKGSAPSSVYARSPKRTVRVAVGNSQPAEPKPRKQKRAAMEANLCPVCGCNIRAVNAAINLGGRA